MRVTFDSNVLIYAIDRDAAGKQQVAMGLLGRAAHADAVLLLQSMGEYFRVCTAKLGMPARDATAMLAHWRSVFPVRAADETAFDAAVAAVQAYRLSFWDAMLWATAREVGCGVILSEDMQDGQVIGGVRIVNPFDPANAGQIDRLFA